MHHLIAQQCPLQPTWTDPYILGALAAAGIIGIIIGFAMGKACSKRGHSCSSDSNYDDDGSCVEIYVGNLSYDMTETQMRKEFERYGEVKSARIISNRFNSKSKGYGFIEMTNRSEAEAAIRALHDKDIFGRKLRVNEAKNKSHE